MKVKKFQKGDTIPSANTEKQWLKDWYSNPITKQRMGADSTKVPEILSNLENVSVQIKKPFWTLFQPAQGAYTERNHTVTITPQHQSNVPLYTHELTHAHNYVPSELPNRYEQEVYNLSSRGKNRDYWNYYSSPDENYAKLMAARRMLNKKPGEIITVEELNSLDQNNLQVKQLNLLYKDKESLAKVLNTIAEAPSPQTSLIPKGQSGLVAEQYKIDTTDPKQNPNRFMQYLYNSPRIKNILKNEGLDEDKIYEELKIAKANLANFDKVAEKFPEIYPPGEKERMKDVYTSLLGFAQKDVNNLPKNIILNTKLNMSMTPHGATDEHLLGHTETSSVIPISVYPYRHLSFSDSSLPKKEFDALGTYVHELSHKIYPHTARDWNNLSHLSQTSLQLGESAGNNDVINYYGDPSEKFARINQLRYLLFKHGIYDATTRDFTLNDLQKAQKSNIPEIKRLLLELHKGNIYRPSEKEVQINPIKDNNYIIKLMNTVANNTKNDVNPTKTLDAYLPDYLKLGGVLKAQSGIKIKNSNGTDSIISKEEYTKLYNEGKLMTNYPGQNIYSAPVLKEVEIKAEKPALRKFIDEYTNQINKETTGYGSMLMAPINAAFSLPQLAATKAISGKVQRPSEALKIENPFGALATDIILDPLNLIGAKVLTNPFKKVPKFASAGINYAEILNNLPKLKQLKPLKQFKSFIKPKSKSNSPTIESSDKKFLEGNLEEVSDEIDELADDDFTIRIASAELPPAPMEQWNPAEAGSRYFPHELASQETLNTIYYHPAWQQLTSRALSKSLLVGELGPRNISPSIISRFYSNPQVQANKLKVDKLFTTRQVFNNLTKSDASRLLNWLESPNVTSTDLLSVLNPQNVSQQFADVVGNIAGVAGNLDNLLRFLRNRRLTQREGIESRQFRKLLESKLSPLEKKTSEALFNPLEYYQPTYHYSNVDVKPNYWQNIGDIPKSEMLSSLIGNLAETLKQVPQTHPFHEKLQTVNRDLHSTAFLRSEFLDNLKVRGKDPYFTDMSILTDKSGTKALVNPDGLVLGNLEPYGSRPDIVHNSAVPRMFHGDTPVGAENKVAEALYRGIARGFIDTQSAPGLISEKHFAETILKNPFTGKLESALRAKRFWDNQVKLTNAKDRQNYYIMVQNWLAPILAGTAAYTSQSD